MANLSIDRVVIILYNTNDINAFKKIFAFSELVLQQPPTGIHGIDHGIELPEPLHKYISKIKFLIFVITNYSAIYRLLIADCNYNPSLWTKFRLKLTFITAMDADIETGRR